LPRSGIREVKALADQMENVIHLEVGEPSFNTPAHIIDAAFEAAGRGETKYTSNYGTPALRRAIAEKYTADWGKEVTPDRVLASTGGVNAIAAITMAIVEPGDEVLVPDPGWPNYISIAGTAHAVPVRYRCLPENGFLPDPAEIERQITPRTKILFICNPSNPTGVVFPAETVEAMVRLAEKHDLYLIADEIYEALVFDGEHVPAARYDTDGRVITISGFSKTYAMTGWRLGYAIANPELVLLAGKMMEPLVSCPTAISQAAGVAALRGPQECVAGMREAYRHRRDIARDLLAPAGIMPVVPQGAFYALLDLRSTDMPSRELALKLLEEERIALAPGDTFGEIPAHGMVRMSLASSDEDVEEGCRRILRFAKRHAAVAAR
ncbi:MAG: pyridoxal phosphate-dependent aminotransferase, partial [Thermomicrobiales bacterium]|nr:pyridoxal phosphate-dependent aminotransferase [Thermomicrobiales bacterium]